MKVSNQSGFDFFTVLRNYQKKLTDLRGNNRSLLLNQLSTMHDLDIKNLDYANGSPAWQIIEGLIKRKKIIKLCDYIDSRSGVVNENSRQLHKIFRKASMIEEERGAKDLFIGYPFVQGKFSDDTPVRCPLLFFPVTLYFDNDQNKGAWYLHFRKEAGIGFNKSFILAYSYFNNIKVNDDFAEASFDDFSKDSIEFRDQLYNFLKESVLEVNFNSENFSNDLQHIQNIRKSDFKRNEKAGQIKLFPQAVLGLFPQAGSFLMPDYEHILAQSAYSSMEEFFLSKFKEGQSFIKEEQTYTSFRIDASQEEALHKIKKGNSMVVQGPPGTGKSQLISNIISDFIARGKKVLLVCQKKAALDVVYERLDSKNITPFVSLIHDYKNERNSLYNKINYQIESTGIYKEKNNSLDTVFLEREFLHSSRQIDQTSDELENFRKALFNDKECGKSPKMLYLTSNPNLPGIDLKEEFKCFPFHSVYHYEEKLSHILPYALKFEKPEFAWKNRISFKNFTFQDKQKIQDQLDYAVKQIFDIKDQLSIISDNCDLEWFWNLSTDDKRLNELIEKINLKELSEFINALLIANQDLEKINRDVKRIENLIQEGEFNIEIENIDDWNEKLENAIEKKQNWHSNFVFNLFSSDKKILKSFLKEKQLRFTKNNLLQCQKALQKRKKLEKKIHKIKKNYFLNPPSLYNNKEGLNQWLSKLKESLHISSILSEQYFFYLNTGSDQPVRTLYQLYHAKDQLKQLLANSRQFLSYEQIHALFFNTVDAEALKYKLNQYFDALVEYDAMLDQLSYYEKKVLYKLIDFNEEKVIQNSQELINIFKNSLSLYWIEFLEQKYPSLRYVSTLRVEQDEEKLQNAIKRKKQLANDILLMKIREQTYNNLEYNRLGNQITYRELKHQVTKKKKIWPVRKLLSEFEEEIFKLIPCWMTSPETVSAVFPLREIFDLVIFDEASQCFAEKGIPAVYRGKQVVITGDSNQLSPNELYMQRWEEQEDISSAAETNALLDLGCLYLPQTSLKVHYRSQRRELIEFSNHHFYQNQLQLLPHYDNLYSSRNPLDFIKVNGIWQNNTNPVEAEKVIIKVYELLKADPDEEIGIVTFNIKQQYLIMDLLEKKTREEGWQIPDSLIVKNIENVQGDEKDVIIFSIGYAPDINGKMVMKFGTLNVEKGENRLNVAITRARKQIIVISSIYPQALKTDNVLHKGPRLLKKFLQYALDVSSNKFTPSYINPPDFSPDWFLKNHLKKNNKSYEESPFPFADLIRKKGEHLESLILTDDNLYYSASSAKELHAYTPMTLKEKKWKYERYYSRNYWLAKQ